MTNALCFQIGGKSSFVDIFCTLISTKDLEFTVGFIFDKRKPFLDDGKDCSIRLVRDCIYPGISGVLIGEGNEMCALM